VQEVGAPFTLTEADLQEPAPDEVVVQIAEVGICRTDVAVKEGHLPFPSRAGKRQHRIRRRVLERRLLSKVQCEIPDVRGDSGIGRTAIGVRNAFLGEADHPWPFVDHQLAQSQRGAGSQRRRQDMLCLVSVAGCGEAERELDRGV
jgi:hypothetical protein